MIFNSGELGGPNIHTFPVYHANVNLRVSSSIGGGHGIFGAVNSSGECFYFFYNHLMGGQPLPIGLNSEELRFGH